MHFLNELEYVNGEILANVWYSDKVIRISPKDGKVLGTYDFAHYHQTEDTGKEDCLNGIAYSTRRQQLYITGKKFSKMWELNLTHA